MASNKDINLDSLNQPLNFSIDLEQSGLNDSQKSNELYQSETSFNKQQQQSSKYKQTLFCLKELILGPQIQKFKRKIKLNGFVKPLNKQRNVVENTKYTILTFIPIVLFNQFKYFFNLFFLLIALTQFFPPLKVGYLFTYFAPLILVLTLTMLKEAYDDIKRYQRDKEANKTQYKILQNNQMILTPSSDLKVGQIIEIRANQRVPADIALLYTNDPYGSVFIKTDQLDGETDWKLRKSIQYIQNYIKDEHDKIQQLQDLDASIKAQQPITNIYEFQGVFKVKLSIQEKILESLSLENTLWANTVLASGNIIGLILYTGKETRMAMNSSNPRNKMGKIDNEINFLTKLAFVLMVTLSLVIIILRPNQTWEWQLIIIFQRYLILLSNIIPISMRVNLDFAKLIYSYRINQDQYIEGTIARNSVIPEELGRIEYLMSDKTGTLTQNDMIFRKLSLENINYTYEEIPLIVQKLQKLSQQSPGPMFDYDNQDLFQSSEISNNKSQNCSSIESAQSDSSSSSTTQNQQQQQQQQQQQGSNKSLVNSKRKVRRDKDMVLKDLIIALAVCHNVTPIINEEDGQKQFQASSPDEVALVKLAKQLGYELLNRSQYILELLNPQQQEEKFQILNIFPFSSETKRMGIIVKHIQSQKIIFYLKGADTIMKQFLPEVQRGFVDEECENLAREGLRTLVITQKLLTQEQYGKWSQKYKLADQLLDNRKEGQAKIVSLLENNMEFLGVTGVEDKLQEQVAQTIDNIKNGGVKVWMLTGDKIETAICIAISSGLKSRVQNIYLIKDVLDDVELSTKLNYFNNIASNTVMVIDGVSLGVALEKIKDLFFKVATQSPAVVCCRCSPTQKAIIVEGVKKHTKKITAAVGDGGNDVAMIQAADVGLGIFGKEGKQAALAADFSILKFMNLNRLLLWHGRLSYKRSSLLAQFVLHRGMVIAFIQIIFICCFYFVSFSLFNSKLTLGYATIFTMFPVFSLIFDEDVNAEVALKFPPLYKTLQKGRQLNAKTFFSWIWKACYQALIIMIMAILIFKMAFLQIETIAFTALVFTEYLMTLSELNKLHIVTIIANILSAILYIIIWVFMYRFMEISPLDHFTMIMKILAITLTSWLPLFIFKFIKKKLDPSDYEKLLDNTKKKQYINTNIFKQ